MSNFKIFGIIIGAIIFLVALSFGLGWVGVGYTKTVGKAKQNAQREVFEETNSFVKAKRQEAIKYYKEYHSAETDEERKAIEIVVSMSLADFDEDRHINDYTLLNWIKEMKY